MCFVLVQNFHVAPSQFWGRRLPSKAALATAGAVNQRIVLHEADALIGRPTGTNIAIK